MNDYKNTCRCGATSPYNCSDRGGCDEFWEEMREAKSRREKPRSYTASDKQLNFMKALVAKKQLTDEKLIESVAKIEALLAEGKGINGVVVSKIIDHAKTCADKATAPKATVVKSDDTVATGKQRGFIKSLVAKKEVPSEVMAQVEGALASKELASKLIGVLMSLPDKVMASA
jgi:hypothetical protein